MTTLRISISFLVVALSGFSPARAQEDPTATVERYSLRLLAPPSPRVPDRIAPQGPLVFRWNQNDGFTSSTAPSLFDNENPVDPLNFNSGQTFTPGETPWRKFAESVEELFYANTLAIEQDSKASFQVVGDDLVVTGNPATQARVRRLLDFLLAARSSEIHLECALVPVASLTGTAPDWEVQQPYLETEVFDRVLTDTKTVLLSAAARPGETVASGVREVRVIVSDLEVNQTGVIPVLNPVTTVPLAGVQLRARPFLLPASRRSGATEGLLLDLCLGRFEAKSTEGKLGERWGDLDFSIRSEALLSVTTYLKAGACTVAGRIGGKAGLVVLVRFAVRGAEMSATKLTLEGKHAVRAIPTELLHRANDFRRWWRRADVFRHDPTWRKVLEQVRQFVSAGDSPQERGVACDLAPGLPGSVVLLTAPEAEHRKVDDLLESQLARYRDALFVGLRIVKVPRQKFNRLQPRLENGFLLPADWETIVHGGGPLASEDYAVFGVPGEVHSVRDASLHTVVTDLENVSGGTGFAIIQTTDPVTDVCGDGREFRVRVEPGADGKTARLAIDGVEAKLEGTRRIKVRLPGLSVHSESKETPKSAVIEMWLRLPEQTVKYWEFERNIPIGRPVILESDAVEGDQMRLLIGSVRRAE